MLLMLMKNNIHVLLFSLHHILMLLMFKKNNIHVWLFFLLPRIYVIDVEKKHLLLGYNSPEKGIYITNADKPIFLLMHSSAEKNIYVILMLRRNNVYFIENVIGNLLIITLYQRLQLTLSPAKHKQSISVQFHISPFIISQCGLFFISPSLCCLYFFSYANKYLVNKKIPKPIGPTNFSATMAKLFFDTRMDVVCQK